MSSGKDLPFSPNQTRLIRTTVHADNGNLLPALLKDCYKKSTSCCYWRQFLYRYCGKGNFTINKSCNRSYMYFVSHALCYTKLRTYLQSSPKNLEKESLQRHLTRPFSSAMLRCDCKVTWLEIHCKMGGGGHKGSRIFQSVSRSLPEIVAYRRASKWYVHAEQYIKHQLFSFL